MNLGAHLPALVIVAPLVGACLAFLAGPRRAAAVAVVTALGTLAFVVALAVEVATSGPVRYALGGWGSLGIVLLADGTAAVFLSVTGVLGLAITLYATAYFRRGEADTAGTGTPMYWTLWLFMWAGLDALLLTGDVFNAYVCLELVGLAAVALVTIVGGADALRAAMRYLFASILGAMTYLLGVALLYAGEGALDMATLSSSLTGSVAGRTGLALMTGALLLKTALVPMHFWLPTAHAAAPSPVSAALSALVVKGSIFLLLRLFLDVMPPAFLGGIDVLLGVLGATAIVWGSLQAVRQHRLKVLVAYSTVAQVGYLFLVFPLAPFSGAVLGGALAGTVVQVASHALAKASMFLAAGTMLERYGHDRIADLAGAARQSPVLAGTFALAGVTMMGLPPSGGFAAKWLIAGAALRAGDWWWAAVVVVGGLLAAVYVFRLLGVFLSSPRAGEVARVPALAPPSRPLRTEWLPLALAAASCALVFAVPIIVRLIEQSSVLNRTGGLTP